MPATNGVSGDHRDYRLGQPTHLHVKVGDVEASDRRGTARVGEIASVTAHALVPTGTEGLVALSGEDDDPDRRVLAGLHQSVRDLDERLWTKGVPDFWAADGDLGDAVTAEVVRDVRVVPHR